MALLAVLSACSSGGSGSGGPTINSFTATPDSLPSAGGSVTLAWDVTGATALSINQSVGSVTPITTGSTVVQVSAATTFTLTATNASGSTSKTAAVTVAAAITLSGTVVDDSRQPYAGQTVVITSGSFSQSVVTDANGAFSVSGVPTPYTATVLDSGGSLAVQYQGLTRSDPTLTDLGDQPTTRSASLAGMLTGGHYPETAAYSTVLNFVSPQATAGLTDPTSASYSSTIDWAGPTTTTGTLYALQIHTVSGLPADYPGYGTLPNVLLEDLGTLTGQNIALSSVTSGTLSGTVSPAAGYTVSDKSMSLLVGSGPLEGALNAVYDTSAGAAFSYTTPSIPNTSIAFSATTTTVAGETSIAQMTGLSASTSGVTLSVPAAQTLTVPVESATGITVTNPFTWTAYAGGISVLYVFGAGPTFYVFTTGTTATIPDLSAAGLPLPSSAAYSWYVIGLGPLADVDAAAAPGGINQLVFGDLTEGESVTRTFTTAN
jgi:hypothetical protein